MDIFLYVLVALFVLIAAVLMLPVRLTIKNDAHNGFILRVSYLFLTFGTGPESDGLLNRLLKKNDHAQQLKKTGEQKSIRSEGLQKSVSDSYAAIVGILKEALALLRRCTVTRLLLMIRCADEEPDQAALHYGLCNAATHSFLAMLRSFLKVREQGCNVDISCDFAQAEPLFRYELTLSVPLGRIVAAALRLVLKYVLGKEKTTPAK